MALDLKGVPNILFDNSRVEELGIAADERNVTTAAVKSFIVGGAGEQYSCTAAFAEVTGMNVTHESKTGKVLVIYSCTTQTGAGEQINAKLQKDGVDVTGTQNSTYVSVGESDYITISGASFMPASPSTQAIGYAAASVDMLAVNGVFLQATIQLPDGATITAAKVVGSAAGETWDLSRALLSDGSATVIASGDINSEDTSISNAVVDNSTYSYVFGTSSLDANDVIDGARVLCEPDPFQYQEEGTDIPLTISYVETNAEKNTWRIVAKSTVFQDDSFINDRILSVIDI